MAKRKSGAGKVLAIFLVIVIIIGAGLYGVYRYFTGDKLLFDLLSAFQSDVKADSLSFTMTYLDDFTVDGKMKLSENPDDLVIDIGGLDKLFNSRMSIRGNQIYLDTLLGSFGTDASDITASITKAISAIRGSEVGDGETPDYGASFDDIPFFGELIKQKREEAQAEKAAKFDEVKYDDCTKKLILNLNKKSYVETFCDSVTITGSDDKTTTSYRYVINKAKAELATVEAYKAAYLDPSVYASERAAAEAKLAQSAVNTLSYTISNGYLTSFNVLISGDDGKTSSIALTAGEFNSVIFETLSGDDAA